MDKNDIDIINICNDYSNGISFRKINKKYGIGIVYLKQILINNNIEIKKSGFSRGKRTNVEHIKNLKIARNTYISEELEQNIINYLYICNNVTMTAEYFNMKYSLIYSIKQKHNIKLKRNRRGRTST